MLHHSPLSLPVPVRAGWAGRKFRGAFETCVCVVPAPSSAVGIISTPPPPSPPHAVSGGDTAPLSTQPPFLAGSFAAADGSAGLAVTRVDMTPVPKTVLSPRNGTSNVVPNQSSSCVEPCVPRTPSHR